MFTGGPENEGGAAATACQSGCENVPEESIEVTVGDVATVAEIDARCPDASMNAILVPSGE